MRWADPPTSRLSSAEATVVFAGGQYRDMPAVNTAALRELWLATQGDAADPAANTSQHDADRQSGDNNNSEPRSSNDGSSWYNSTGTWWSDPAAHASSWTPTITLPTRGADVYLDDSKGRSKGKGGRRSDGTSWWQGTSSWSDQRYTAFGSPPPFNASIDTEFTGDPMNLSCLLYTSPSPRDRSLSRMPSSA